MNMMHQDQITLRQTHNLSSRLTILSIWNHLFQSNKNTQVVATTRSRIVAAFGVRCPKKAALLVEEGLFALGVFVGPSLAMSAGAFSGNAMGAEVGLEVDGSEIGRSAHIFVPSLLSSESRQCPSNPSQVFVHFATRQVAPVSPSHSSNGSTLDAA